MKSRHGHGLELNAQHSHNGEMISTFCGTGPAQEQLEDNNSIIYVCIRRTKLNPNLNNVIMLICIMDARNQGSLQHDTSLNLYIICP